MTSNTISILYVSNASVSPDKIIVREGGTVIMGGVKAGTSIIVAEHAMCTINGIGYKAGYHVVEASKAEADAMEYLELPWWERLLRKILRTVLP